MTKGVKRLHELKPPIDAIDMREEIELLSLMKLTIL